MDCGGKRFVCGLDSGLAAIDLQLKQILDRASGLPCFPEDRRQSGHGRGGDTGQAFGVRARNSAPQAA